MEITKERKELVKELTYSIYKSNIYEALDECIDKNVDLGTVKLLKKIINESVNQISDIYIGVIMDLKSKISQNSHKEDNN